MIYNSFSFLILFPLLFLLYYAIPARMLRWRNGFLLLVSYLLYANWKPAYALILFGITLVTYVIARYIEDGKRDRVVVVGGNFDSLSPVGVQVLQLHQ